ncbi:hypothetical protein [Halopiger goleimassiliensis]|uniref:hypothetical protein n=1 Tax=Halopiger goleimassiliensis TaxID=1293048 RepID=UPI000AEDB63C|nr:hypothetical protein [Halopiger goleimassiliensis]
MASALALVAIAYVVSRYADRLESVPSVGELRERTPAVETVREGATQAVPGDFEEIPITGSDESTDESTPSGGEGGTEPITDAETTVDLTDEERSPAELAERADEEVPEPGEMAVDEDVVDDLVDEDGTDQAQSDEDESADADDASESDAG